MSPTPEIVLAVAKKLLTTAALFGTPDDVKNGLALLVDATGVVVNSNGGK